MQFLVLSREKGRERVSKVGCYCCNRHVSTLIQSWLSFKQISKPELPSYTKKKKKDFYSGGDDNIVIIIDNIFSNKCN